MWRVVAIMAIALAARTAQSAELRSSLTGSAQHSTNARSSGDSQDGGGDGDVRLDGQARFDLRSDPDGRFSWRLGYAPTYERFLDLQELDNWRHHATGGFTYRFSPATTLGGNANFTRSIRTNFEDDLGLEPPPVEPSLEETDEEIDRGSFGLSLSHLFGPRWSGSTGVSYSFTDYGREDRSDFEAAGATASLSYAMTPRQSLGGGLSLSRQVVKQADLATPQGEVSTGAEQETRFASLFGTWNYRLSPLWRLDMRAGPTLIDSDLGDTTADLAVPRVPVLVVQIQGDPPTLLRIPYDAALCSRAPCPDTAILPLAFPPGFQIPSVDIDSNEFLDQGSSTTVFADFGIAREGERTQFGLRYSRSAGENFGGRTSTVSDVLSSTWRWQPDADWKIDCRASYAKRQQATSASVLEGFPLVANAGTVSGVPDNAAIIAVGPDGRARVLTGEVDDAFDVDSWGLSVRATRRVTRRVSGFVRASYTDQKNNGVDRSVIQDQDDFEIGLGVTYTFDPVRF
jgi:hypothetical protein